MASDYVWLEKILDKFVRDTPMETHERAYLARAARVGITAIRLVKGAHAASNAGYCDTVVLEIQNEIETQRLKR
jgi:hypothetical protein